MRKITENLFHSSAPIIPIAKDRLHYASENKHFAGETKVLLHYKFSFS